VSRAVQGLLYGVEPLDPVTFATVLLLLLGVGFIAAFVPARRAAHVDPATTLRYE
jgi:ABC-type lipoprotein release transport system permease subunit